MVRVSRPSCRWVIICASRLSRAGFVGLGVKGAQLRIEEFRLGRLAGRLVAMDHFERPVA